MGTWQVTAIGWGFMKDGVEHDCELSGLVRAEDSNDAFSKVCSLAMRDHPELLQAAGPFPRPVINAEEIQAVPNTRLIGADQIELHWIKK